MTQDLTSLLEDPIRKMIHVPDLKAQMARIKELKEAKVQSVSSYQLAKEER